MASKPLYIKKKPFPLLLIVLLICLKLSLLIYTTTYNLHSNYQRITVTHNLNATAEQPHWYDKLQFLTKNRLNKLRIGLVNVELADHSLAEQLVVINFEKVDKDKKWENVLPGYNGKWGPVKCPEIPMPPSYEKVDIVVAQVPDGVRDVFRLQINLVVANVLVNSGWDDGDDHREMYVVFIGRSRPMLEIFRCDDMIWEEGDYRIYKPDIRRLNEKVNMHVGSCMKSSPSLQSTDQMMADKYTSKEAYVTVLHSSEAYVCGAIALAQSILQTNSTKDLILLADHSISPTSLGELKAAGWKIKLIERIRSPHARKGAYNEYNCSKLRIWQLVEYTKVIFIDAYLIVLKNLDELFNHPQLSAVENNRSLFNSGLILIEPSQCMFNTLMEKIYTLGSYNGGDQGFLNEAFSWWHRFHSKVNYLKYFHDTNNNTQHEIPDNLYTIHYLGLKPSMCYKDYDCNWDMADHRRYASDSAHKKWWKVYEMMNSKLRPFCGLTKQMYARIKKTKRGSQDCGF